MHQIKSRFVAWRNSNHHILHRVDGVADCGYLLATLAELHTAHVVAVAVLLCCGVVRVLVIGDFE